jgi:hypothetical protein
MKTFFIFLGILAVPVMYSSCKKSKTQAPATTSTYYVKLKVNGTAKSMTMTPIVMFTSAPPLYLAQLSGYFPNDFGSGANFTLEDSNSFNTSSTYTAQYVKVNGTVIGQPSFSFTSDDGKAYIAAPATPGTAIALNFTEITASYVKGTFSGTMQLEGTSTFAQITDGQFYLKRE